MSGISTVMYILVAVIFGMMMIKMVKEMLEKNKKPKYAEIPRDTRERLVKAYKTTIKGKLNKSSMRHTLFISGDEFVPGRRVGDILGYEPMNEEIICHIRKHWWMFWKRTTPLHLDVQLCTDWNAKHIVVEARGFEALTEGEIYPIPRRGTKFLEAIYIQRAKTQQARVAKQTIYDLDTDSDIMPKMALRGDMGLAYSEVGRFEEMPRMKEEDLRKSQDKLLKKRISEN